MMIIYIFYVPRLQRFEHIHSLGTLKLSSCYCIVLILLVTAKSLRTPGLSIIGLESPTPKKPHKTLVRVVLSSKYNTNTEVGPVGFISLYHISVCVDVRKVLF